MEEDPVIIADTEKRETKTLCKIIVVRHAESIANSQGVFQGQIYDTDLSELGRKQVEILAKRLHRFGLSKILTCPLKRTYQTAFLISNITGTEIVINEEIKETNHGEWEGKHVDWIRQNYKDLYQTWQTSPGSTLFPNGEHFMQTVERTLNFLQLTKFENNTLVVTHDNILRSMITLINNMQIDKMWDIVLEPLALNIFEVNRVDGINKFRILRINDTIQL